MYVGILRVHDANRCPPLRKILKDPCNRSQKDRRAATYKKTPLSFDIGKTTVFHTASLRLWIFFCEALLFKCRNNRAVSAPALQSKAPSRLAKAFQFFKASAFVPDVICQGTPAKKRDKEKGERKGRKKSGKQVKVPISAEFEQKDVMLHLFSQGCP